MAAELESGSTLGHLVWAPYAHMVSLSSSSGLVVKLGSLALLLTVTLLCGFVPLWLFRRPSTATGTSVIGRKTLSLVSCFAGGVFLATCLLDLIPDYLASINSALASLRVTLCFPLQEFILAMGFFLVLIMEQIALAYKDPEGSQTETQALLGPDSHHSSASIQDQGWPDGPAQHPSSQHPPGRVTREHPHVHVDLNSHSAIRSLVLFLALSLHSVFEGLGVGLQEESAQVLEICLALLIHKGVIAFSLTLKLLQGNLRPRAVLGSLIIFSIMSPLGIGLGVALTVSPGPVLSHLARSVLEGLATGTFVYITFMEILPHELASSDHRIGRLIILLLGFALISGILFIKF